MKITWDIRHIFNYNMIYLKVSFHVFNFQDKLNWNRSPPNINVFPQKINVQDRLVLRHKGTWVFLMVNYVVFSFYVVSRENSITFLNAYLFFCNEAIQVCVLVFIVALLTCKSTGSYVYNINYYIVIIQINEINWSEHYQMDNSL